MTFIAVATDVLYLIAMKLKHSSGLNLRSRGLLTSFSSEWSFKSNGRKVTVGELDNPSYVAKRSVHDDAALGLVTSEGYLSSSLLFLTYFRKTRRHLAYFRKTRRHLAIHAVVECTVYVCHPWTPCHAMPRHASLEYQQCDKPLWTAECGVVDPCGATV